jgi:hypothetical protein
VNGPVTNFKKKGKGNFILFFEPHPVCFVTFHKMMMRREFFFPGKEGGGKIHEREKDVPGHKKK